MCARQKSLVWESGTGRAIAMLHCIYTNLQSERKNTKPALDHDHAKETIAFVPMHSAHPFVIEVVFKCQLYVSWSIIIE